MNATISAAADPVVVLTRKEAAVVHDALRRIGALVPQSHTWTPEERKLWERADAALRRARIVGE